MPLWTDADRIRLLMLIIDTSALRASGINWHRVADEMGDPYTESSLQRYYSRLRSQHIINPLPRTGSYRNMKGCDQGLKKRARNTVEDDLEGDDEEVYPCAVVDLEDGREWKKVKEEVKREEGVAAEADHRLRFSFEIDDIEILREDGC